MGQPTRISPDVSQIQDIPTDGSINHSTPYWIADGIKTLMRAFPHSKMTEDSARVIGVRLIQTRFTQDEMRLAMTVALDECTHFPTIAFLLKAGRPGRSGKTGETSRWGSQKPAVSPATYESLSPSERRWVDDRNTVLWEIKAFNRRSADDSALAMPAGLSARLAAFGFDAWGNNQDGSPPKLHFAAAHEVREEKSTRP